MVSVGDAVHSGRMDLDDLHQAQAAVTALLAALGPAELGAAVAVRGLGRRRA